MLKRKITEIKYQLKKINLYMLGKECRLLIFFKMTFFRKIAKKSGIPQSGSNSLDQDQVGCQ